MRNYYKILIGALMLIGGCNFTTDYFSDEIKAHLDWKIKGYEKLVASPTETVAMLDSVYTERKLIIMGVPLTTYETEYFFSVDNRRYAGKYNPSEPPTVPFIRVQYLAEDPRFNAHNPKQELRSLQESKTSNADLYIGIILLILGAATIYTHYSAIRQRKREEELAILQEIEAFNREKGVLQ